MTTRIGPPSINPSRQNLRDLCIVQRLNLGRLDKALRERLLCNLALDISPDERAIFGEVVTLVAPGSLAATSGRCFTQSQVDVAQILDMNLVPDVLAFANQEPLAALQDRSTEQISLDALGVSRSTARSVDGGWADDCRMDARRIPLPSADYDFIDIAVQCIGGEIDQLAHAFPVIVFFWTLNTVGFSTLVFDCQDASAGGMNEPEWALARVVLGAIGNSLSRSYMVAVGKV